MRFHELALLTAVVGLGACGGGEKTPSADTTAAAPSVTPTPAPGGLAKAPATGKTVAVKMVQAPSGAMEFQPKDITISQGDAVEWTTLSGPPHNIVFAPEEIPAAARPQLQANMDNPTPELNSPLLLNIGDKFTLSFAGVPPGTYPYHCTPHLATGMSGTITVK